MHQTGALFRAPNWSSSLHQDFDRDNSNTIEVFVRPHPQNLGCRYFQTVRGLG